MVADMCSPNRKLKCLSFGQYEVSRMGANID